MTGRKQEFSKLCLTGFILSVMPALLLPLSALSSKLPRTLRISLTEDILPAAFIIFPLAGFIVSIIGLVNANKEDKRGKGFGVAGVVFPSIAITIVLFVLGMVFFHSSGSAASLRKNDMYEMGTVGSAENTEYDVSQLRIPEGYDFKSLNITVSEAELKAYAESKLATISKESEKSIRGTYQDYNFLIIRSDKLDAWLSSNRPGGFLYNYGYAYICYEKSWEFAATRPVPLEVYMDPSDKFIVITNCSDYKVISDFFGITDNYIEPAVTTEMTYSPEFFENNEMVVFLKDNINEDMSLPEVVDVFEKMYKEYHPANDLLKFYTINDCDGHYDDNGEYVIDGEYYCFYLERWVSLDEGLFSVELSVVYELNTTNKNIKQDIVMDYQLDDDFFEYVRNSKAYEYLSTADIVRIDIEMKPL